MEFESSVVVSEEQDSIYDQKGAMTVQVPSKSTISGAKQAPGPNSPVTDSNTEHTYIDLLQMYEEKWKANSPEKMDLMGCINILLNNMDANGLIMKPDSLVTLRNNYESLLRDMHIIRGNLKNDKLISDDVTEDNNTKRINKVLEIMFHTTNALKSMIKMRQLAFDSAEPDINDDWSITRFMPCNDSEMNTTQKLITNLLFKFWDLGYKRYKDSCYAPIRTEDGYNTHAYECVGNIEDIMYELCSDQYADNENWKCITSGNAAKATQKYLCKCKDQRFENLFKNRYAYAFRDGTYIVYNKDDMSKSDKFVKYDDSKYGDIVGDTVCCKYFDCNFPIEHYNTDPKNWRDIPTPTFDKILNHQKISKEVQNAVIQYFVGRCLYDVGELDDSQVSLFILGRAGTGKSTIVNKMIGEFYDSDDVGVLSSNIEGKFGLAPIADTFVVIAPEVKRDCGLPQTDFQGMITGEWLQLAVKNCPSIKVKWKPPLISAGNQLYGYSDNSGSLTRRLPVMEFDELVKVGDSNLGPNLTAEIPTMILKSNRGYLDYVRTARETGINDIWHYLPQYFIDNKLRVSAKTQGCLHFIMNKLVSGDREKRIKLDDFVLALNTHMRDFGFPKQPFDKDLWMAPFEAYKLNIEKDRSRHTKVQYVYGCEFLENSSETDLENSSETDLENSSETDLDNTEKTNPNDLTTSDSYIEI